MRIARAMRFSAVLGFSIEPETARAMLALRERLSLVAVERIWQEWKTLLCAPDAAHVLRAFAPAAFQMIPQLEPCRDRRQYNPHHFGTVWEHTLAALEGAKRSFPCGWRCCSMMWPSPVLFPGRKGRGHFYGHAAVSSQMADEICRNLRLDNGCGSG